MNRPTQATPDDDLRYRIVPGWHTREASDDASEERVLAELGREAYSRPVVCHIKPRHMPLVVDDVEVSLFARLRQAFRAFVRRLWGRC